MAKVAVEQTLSNVKELLQQSGIDVVNLDQNIQTNNVECCVISGQDKDMMGMSDMQADVPVINADGLTAEETVQKVKQRFNIGSPTS